MERVNIVAEGLLFPEGPVATRDGSVLVSEIRGSRITRVAPDGTKTIVADCGGGPNGAAFGPDGALYVCNNGGNTYAPGHFAATGPALDYKGGSIQRVDMATGEISVLYGSCDGQRLSSPNDLVFDRFGGFYFTDMGKSRARDRDHGGLYYALADGSRINEVAYKVQAANGVGLSPDGNTVYVAETETSRLWAFDIIEPGRVRRQAFPSPHGGRLICGLPGFQRFDSLALDARGNICVATLMTGHITVIAPGGEVLRQVKFPDSYVTNICFGGEELRTAYVTLSESGRLASMSWPEPGLRLNFNA
ncbi:MAG: SMP-30/gluconolactonase/LRE family protein [Pseudomonadota bacterium]